MTLALLIPGRLMGGQSATQQYGSGTTAGSNRLVWELAVKAAQQRAAETKERQDAHPVVLPPIVHLGPFLVPGMAAELTLPLLSVPMRLGRAIVHGASSIKLDKLVVNVVQQKAVARGYINHKESRRRKIIADDDALFLGLN